MAEVRRIDATSFARFLAESPVNVQSMLLRVPLGGGLCSIQHQWLRWQWADESRIDAIQADLVAVIDQLPHDLSGLVARYAVNPYQPSVYFIGSTRMCCQRIQESFDFVDVLQFDHPLCVLWWLKQKHFPKHALIVIDDISDKAAEMCGAILKRNATAHTTHMLVTTRSLTLNQFLGAPEPHVFAHQTCTRCQLCRSNAQQTPPIQTHTR